MHGQAISVNGGAISGTITDQSGAVIPNATVTISSPSTGYTKTLTTTDSGFYTVGPLNPGKYQVTVVQSGFNQLQVETVVRTGTVTNGNFKMIVGGTTDTIQVTEGEIQLNTEQVGVSSVITPQQFNTLPVNGRNFLDLAQLEPGVILQSGDTFDPTKAGYSALSFSGISGRSTRILLDGQDISDENVGTTIFNVSQGSVSEMQVNRSTADPSTDITSSGSVLVSTRSGTNQFHGQLFYNFQDSRALFARDTNGVQAPFQRNQYGGSIGGPIIKDKLFFFANSERNKQDASVATSIATGAGAHFGAIAAQFPTVPNPTRDTYSSGRLDYNGPGGSHYFVRVNYEVNAFAATFDEGYSLFANRDNAPGIAGGADFVFGRMTHSFRGSYEKFHNLLTDATTGNASLYNPIPQLHLYGPQGFEAGPNENAPQTTFQSDKQFRYDATWTKGSHTIRFGANLNRILAGGYASFFATAPYVAFSSSTAVSGGDLSDPINGYHPFYFYVGNGQGYSTEKPGFGRPAGGQGDWRTAVYIADTWKVTPTFTLSFGARWQRDTGRQDADLAPLRCSDLNAGNFLSVPCTGDGYLLDQFGPGLGGRIQQPNKNVGPQIGFVYNPAASPKTVFRGGLGIFFENTVFNNVLFDRPLKLKTGRFLDYELLCYQGTYTLNIAGKGPVTENSNGVSIESMCNSPIGQAAPQIVQLQADFQAGAASVGNNGANSSYVGETLRIPGGGLTAFAPQFRTPYSIHINFGIQRELWKGAILSADYVHQAGLRIPQSLDANHVGDARYFNPAAASGAIAYTNSHTELLNSPGTFCDANDTECAIANGATIADYASNGLDSGASYLNGSPASYYSITPDEGAAFPGINPGVGQGVFNFPGGKSGYDALQVQYRQQLTRRFGAFSDTNIQISYALSRYVTNVADSTGLGGSDPFFGAGARDYRDPSAYMGYGGSDHRHNVSFGMSTAIKYGPRVGLIGHFRSAAPTSLSLSAGPIQAGQIFITDVTGDGTTSDLVPGTLPGAYMRQYGPNDVNKLINQYNSTQAGTLTPAGEAVVNAGLLTQDQMVRLHGVKPKLVPAPAHAYPNSPFRQLDANVSYPIKLHWLGEQASLEPAIAMYNVLNLGNYGGPSGSLAQYHPISGADLSNSGTVNGEYSFDAKSSNRVARGSGTFAQGAPRITEFQLKLNF